MTDASQPQNEAAEIELNVRSEGSSGLTPESGVAVLGENRRIVFQESHSNNNVMFESVFRYQEVEVQRCNPLSPGSIRLRGLLIAMTT